MKELGLYILFGGGILFLIIFTAIILYSDWHKKHRPKKL